MPALQVQTPLTVLQDRDGQPLDNGFIFVGVENLNPQTNPIIVYADPTLTIIVPQPLRTLAGYIYVNGTPAQIFVAETNYSLRVLDKNANTVFNASSKFNPNLTAVTQSFGNNTTLIATTAFVQSAVQPLQAAIQALYPVGTIYINSGISTNPASYLGFGTWTAFGAGRVPVGFNAGNPLFDAAEETGGSADSTLPTHNHTATFTGNALGTHQHFVGSNDSTANDGGNPGGQEFVKNAGSGNGASAFTNFESAGTPAGSVSVASAGSSGTNANYQPYITVYMWKRTA